MRARHVLVLGATGYIGSRLVPRLLEAGYPVRALGRSRAKLAAHPWASDPRVELVEGDVQDASSLRRAMAGCEVVVHLVHSMESRSGRYVEADRDAARNVAKAAADAGVARIVYLGGMGDADDPRLSRHLRSRQEVGRLLAAGPVPVTELRAGVILGSGSASFEILRYLTDRLPVMVTPRWVSTPCQPIAVRDVLAYLVGCLDSPATVGDVFEIGGPEVLTYRRLMEIYAEEAGLRRRLVVPVPVLTPRLSSYWIHLVTPAPASLARPLADGLRNPVVVRDERLRTILPRELLAPRDAIRAALAPTPGEPSAPESSLPSDPPWTGGTVLRDARSRTLALPPAKAWRPIARLGRAWSIVELDPERHVRLLAPMKLPGRATLAFDVAPEGVGGSTITQTATFVPKGLGGLLYGRLLLPLHELALRNMLRGIAREAARPLPRVGV